MVRLQQYYRETVALKLREQFRSTGFNLFDRHAIYPCIKSDIFIDSQVVVKRKFLAHIADISFNLLGL
jgi:hypothetical protein